MYGVRRAGIRGAAVRDGGRHGVFFGGDTDGEYRKYRADRTGGFCLGYILLLFVSVMVTGGRVKSNMSDVFPDQREEKQDDWDFDADEDFDFGFGDDFSEDDFGDYF